MHKYFLGFLLFVPQLLFSTAYHVGVTFEYSNISDVPIELLKAGDTVYIHYRQEPYKEKFVIGANGTQTQPVVIHGVLSENGDLPIIDGNGAVTRTELDYWNENRGLIKIGGTSTPSDNANWIVVENLDIRNARPGYYFTDKNGSNIEYTNNAASVYIEKGENLTIRNCKIHDSGNGIFCTYTGKKVTVEYCEIYDNGIEGRYYEHNTYTEADSIIFQFNRFGKLREGCLGNNLKDRSAGTIIRYNWIEGGNRQLDLVESDHYEIYNQEKYRSTYVYNNVLLELENEGNRQICHYGGDNGNSSIYRKGTLYFYNNTIVSTRNDRTTLLRLSSGDEKADVRNNVIYIANGGENLEIATNSGTIDLYNNWISNGWYDSFESVVTVNDIEGNIAGSTPGFVNFEELDFNIADGSELIGNAGSLSELVPSYYYPEYSFISEISTFTSRSNLNDIGAFEYTGTTAIRTSKTKEITIFPNPNKGIFTVKVSDITNFNCCVFDITGNIVYAGHSKNHSVNIYLENPKSGEYLLMLEEKGNFTTHKFCVVK